MQVSLMVTRPKGGTKTFQVSKPEVVFGRSKECDMQILSTEVSRRHCQFKISDESVTVRDLGSANGTIVNGKTIQANTDIPLLPETLVEIGPLKVVVGFTPPASISDKSATVPAIGDGTVLNETPTKLELAAHETSDEIPIVSNLEAQPEPSTTPPNFQETQDEIVLPPKQEMAPVKAKARTNPETPAASQDAPASDDELLETLEPDDESTVVAEAAPPAVVIDADAVPVAEAFADAGSVTEPAAEPVGEEKKSGGLKSLFGLMGRGKKKAAPDETVDAQPQPAAETDLPPETAPMIEMPAAPMTGVSESAVLDVPDETEDVDAVLEDIEEEYSEEELQALLAEEGLEDELAEPETPVVNTAPPPPADPGLADFLNQIGQDG